MNDNEIRNAFDRMTETVHPERVEDAVRERLSAKEKQRRIRFPRAVVAAACVLALTAVSAGAYGVYRKNVGIRLGSEIDDVYISDAQLSYEVSYGVEDNEQVVFADEKIKEFLNYERQAGKTISEVGKKFSTWEEAAEWLDCGLLTSNLLDKPSAEHSSEGKVAFAVHSAQNGEPFYAVVTGTSDLPLGEYYCNMSVLFPLSEQCGNKTYAVARGEVVDMISYAAKNGLSAEIIVTEKPKEIMRRTEYLVEGYIYHSGLMYTFQLSDSTDKDTAVTYMKQILDSLE